MIITPIIMESEVEVVKRKIEVLRRRGVRRVQFDIGDGLFSDWLGVSPSDLMELDVGGLEVDIHLMVDDPVEWIEECVALLPKRVIAQIERMGSQTMFIETIRSYQKDVETGLALMIDTPIASIEKEALKKASVVLLLAVPAGTSGSKFDDRVIEKICQLRKIYKGNIMIDGGINGETMKQVEKVGADEVAINSYYWRKINEQNTKI